MDKKPASAWRAWRAYSFGENWRLPLAALLSLLTGLGYALVSILITTQSVHTTLGWLTGKPLATLACALFLALLVMGLTFLTRSLFAGGLAVGLLVLAASFVNYFKQLITSTPLYLTDIGLIGKVTGIAKLNSASIHFSRNSILAIAAVVLWLVLLFALSRKLRADWKWSLPMAAVPVLAFVLLFYVNAPVDAWLYRPLGVTLDQSFGQAYVNERTTVPMGLWRSALCLWKESGAFDEGDREEVLADAQDYIDGIDAGGSETKPNVIMILSESFFDVTKLPGVTLRDIDYFDTLSKNNEQIRLKELDRARAIMEEDLDGAVKEILFHPYIGRLAELRAAFAGRSPESLLFMIRDRVDSEELKVVLKVLDGLETWVKEA